MDINWHNLVKFHGHSCPGLALGYGMVRLAMDELGVKRDADEELVAIFETDACSVDALQFVLGCTLGKGNLIYHNTGKNAFSIFCRKSGRSIRIVASSHLIDAIDKEEKTAKILALDPREYCQITKVHQKIPPKARIFKSVACEICGEKLAENRAGLQDGKIVCVDCQDEYSRQY
ncbi:MAG: FmdE family protein [Bacillota bacterium]|jgi:formylmethanofuran dehydrogenase subunit E